jgi:hypothetical protein
VKIFLHLKEEKPKKKKCPRGKRKYKVPSHQILLFYVHNNFSLYIKTPQICSGQIVFVVYVFVKYKK